MRAFPRLAMHKLLFSLFTAFLLLHSAPSNADVVLDCGAKKGGEDYDKRKWDPDTKYVVAEKSIQSTASYQDPSLLSSVPYMTARIFSSSGTYRIPIKTKQRYFARFHFYPETYSGLNISNSYFSVVANGVTLLSNFSAAITCRAYTQSYLVKEYSLAPGDDPVLNITFVPSDKYKDSFAFINGIEVIQMPDLFDVTPVVGFTDNSIDGKTMNFQTMFRLNVGGQNIPPSQDWGGLSRTWYQDNPYIFGAGTGIQYSGAKVKIDYRNLSVSAAPVDVYSTARSLGPSPEVNVKTNMTWIFQIDANFTYIMRLHFCEIQYSKINQRVFNIYMNNQSAQADPDPADIIGWTGGKGIPTYKDYAILVQDKVGDDEIWLQMTPSTLSKPEFFDIQLNGLEIFKVETSKNLAGLNPQPSPLQARIDPDRSFENENLKYVIIGAAGGFAAFLIFAFGFFIYNKKSKTSGTEFQFHTSSWLPVYGNSHMTGSKSTRSGKSNAGSHLSTLAQGLCRRFTLLEMTKGTKNFDKANVIGVGGFGKVYKGTIDGTTTKVAIKRSNPNSEQGINEFQTEIEMLSKLRHKHLVSLIGFCEEDGEMCLVYDFMAYGTLREHLYNTKKPHLSWKQRLEISIGSARGLHYLHTGAKYTIIHRDVKTTNILLDENMVAKVSDFGLSKTGPDMDNGHVTTVVKGSFGYLDPEYFRRQQLTEKSDVYSFGVVLFEVLCARPALNPSLPKEQVSLADWALSCKRKGTLDDLIDPNVKRQINPECYKKFADTAEKCLSDHGHDRPSMGDVLWNLEFCLQLQETADGSMTKHGSHRSQGSNMSEDNNNDVTSEEPDMAMNVGVRSEHEISDESSNDNDSDSDSDIFSQILNPKGR